MDRDPHSRDDDNESARGENQIEADEVASAAITMRRLIGVPGEWWTLEGETDDQYLAASADSWVELDR